MHIPESNLPRIVVVGGGFAGLQFCKRVNKNKFQIVLLDRHNYHTFQPLLYQVATAGLEPDSIAYPIRKIFEDQRENFFFRIGEAKNIDAEQQILETTSGKIAYDYLVIATGSKTNYFGNKVIEENAMPMKTIPQSLNLRSLFLQNFEQTLLTDSVNEREKLMNFVIVGGGPTGTELVGAIAELKNHVLPNDYPDLDFTKMNIHLVEAGERLLAGMSETSGKRALKYLQNMGVKVWLKTAVDSYDGEVIKTNTSKTIPTRFLIWAAGVQGSPIKGIPEEQIQRGNRIAVDENNKVIYSDNIFALGDVAMMVTDDYPRGHPMVAQPAIQQGRLLAKNIERLVDGKPLKAFKYSDKGSMATIGRNRAVAELQGMKFTGLTAWFIWMFVHLMALVGFRNKAVTFVNWVFAYVNYDKGARLIIRAFDKKRNLHEEKVPVGTGE
ncbi:MAG: FAD-dependent oxidoreductase [Crocinitomicaceae bacterium]|nr:FAD-dependent oxidoreductase [Crocinitomicaceae bacterium]|tara:strand:- start:9554 stop:10870 length:1317 start_codon:yes stop_codon:yes gene_type:complete